MNRWNLHTIPSSSRQHMWWYFVFNVTNLPHLIRYWYSLANVICYSIMQSPRGLARRHFLVIEFSTWRNEMNWSSCASYYNLHGMLSCGAEWKQSNIERPMLFQTLWICIICISSVFVLCMSKTWINKSLNGHQCKMSKRIRLWNLIWIRPIKSIDDENIIS